MVIAFSGDRHFKDALFIKKIIDGLIKEFGTFTLIQGKAKGVDQISRYLGLYIFHLDIVDYPADWDTYGKAAGTIRNQEMVDSKPDLVIAIHPNLEESKGTADMINRCKVNNISVRYYTGRESYADFS